MNTRPIAKTSTDPSELLTEVNLTLNKLNIGSGPEDPPVALLIQPTGKFIEGEAELKVTIFEGFKSDVDIAESLLPPGYGNYEL